MKIGIIGMGLIGGSLGRALVQRTDHTVYGYDRNEGAMQKGALLNAYHERLTSSLYPELDVLILAVYPETVAKLLNEVAPKLKSGALVADASGTKRKVVATMKELSKQFPELLFAGAHPMAGREFSGIEHSVKNLFDKASLIVVPVALPLEARAQLKREALRLGFSGVVFTTAEEHDRIIAFTSQLAHIVSSAYMRCPMADEHKGFSAGSFRDLTRVARLNPEMWTQLMMENGDFLADEVETLMEKLAEYRDALRNNDTEKLYAILADGNLKKLSSEKKVDKGVNDENGSR